MTEKSQERSPKAPSTEEPFDAMAHLQKAGFGNMMGMSAAWVVAISEINAEVVGFVADRIKEDVKTQHDILHCKKPSDLQHIQAQFMQRAMDQYKVETGKLVEMGNKALGTKNNNGEA